MFLLKTRIYYEFVNLLFTLEHVLGTAGFLLMGLFPSSDLGPPYCYICHKNWFEMIDEKKEEKKLSKRREIEGEM